MTLVSNREGRHDLRIPVPTNIHWLLAASGGRIRLAQTLRG
jgi:hypothetical protein